MGLIPALLLLSNCKASLRENIDLLLIKSNYIFFPLHSVYPEILQCHILFPPCVYTVFPIQYHGAILCYDCCLFVPLCD